MIANYHTHTFRCGHAANVDERVYVERAIQNGLTDFGFSEHAPMPFTDKTPAANLPPLLNMRMKLHETEGYVNTLLSLRKEYKNDINIHIGFEVEYFDSCFDAFMEHISPFPIDYLILGQHFGAPESESVAHYASKFGSDGMLNQYVNDVIKGIETNKISYVAHPDMPCYVGKIEVYESEMTRLIRCANEHNVPLEMNLYGLQQIRNYPNITFWQLANDIGCDVVIGLDAHKPENVINELALKYANKIIESHSGLNLLEKINFKTLK